MLKNKLDKKIGEIQATFENILICNDKRSRPFIEITVQNPDNVEQQNLGTLIGIFEISDMSEDSSYIVNYLLSIIKKEYFLRPRRGPVESFEAALHKANLALSKLAEHKNIGWIGKLNVICAVLEKNKLHLAKTGAASAFLLRSRTLTDISEDLSEPETEPNPLKTFDNVSSGKLEIDDKLIITTDNIFEIFSFEEIKKSALRFSDGELIQFLKTALGNQLERAAALIVDIKEKTPEPEVIVSRQRTAKINAFSQDAFVKPAKSERAPSELETEIKSELDKRKDDFVNKQTGHIYIKEVDHPPVTSNFFGDLSFHFDNFFEALRSRVSKAGRAISGVLKKSFQLIWAKAGRTKIASPKINVKQWLISAKNFLIAPFKTMWGAGENQEAMKIEEALQKTEIRRPKIEFSFLPSFSRIKDSLASLSYEYKLYAILTVLAIFLVPYFGLQIQKRMTEKKVPVIEEVAPVIIPLAQDKSVVRLENLVSAYSGQDILGPINLNGKLFAVSQADIAVLDSGEKFTIPQDFGRITVATGMNDLNLIFLLGSEGKTVSFSSVSKKFQNNTLAVPQGMVIADAKTYLTYIYLLDAKNNQIYRYPRAEGGFGKKSDWMKEPLDLSGATNMTISENIFVANEGNVLRLFRGKKQDFNMEQSATPIVPFKVNVSADGNTLYVLDKVNSRIVKLDASGNIISQYYNSEIGNANNLTIDEASNSIYFSTLGDIKSFKME